MVAFRPLAVGCILVLAAGCGGEGGTRTETSTGTDTPVVQDSPVADLGTDTGTTDTGTMDTSSPQDVSVVDLGTDTGTSDMSSPSDVPVVDQMLDSLDAGVKNDIQYDALMNDLIDTPKSDTDTPLPEEFYYPPLTGDDWETVSPAQLGWNTAKLEDAITYVGNNKSTAFIILYRGRIVTERYWDEWGPHSNGSIASAAKSVTSILCGLAVQEGKLDISKTVTSYLPPGWSGTDVPAEKEALITVRHLLTMTSGLMTSDLGNSLFWKADAGTIWYYNTPAYKVLADVIGITTGMTLKDFSQQHLQSVIGMQDSKWVWVTKSFISSARDMARFGLMVLGGGTWDGKTVLPEAGYLAQSLDPSQQLNPSYGYLWWLNGKLSYLLPGNPAEGGAGSLIPDAPNDLVAALGMGDKKIYVVKSLDLVVVRHGDATGIPQLALTSFDNILWQKLMAAIP